MRHKLIIILALSIIFTTLSACADEGGQFMNPVIESSSVEIGTVQNPNDGLLHFLVQIYDSGMEPDQAYKVRFIIQEPYISDLIEMEGFEIPETYKTLHEENAIHTGSFGEIKKIYTR